MEAEKSIESGVFQPPSNDQVVRPRSERDQRTSAFVDRLARWTTAANKHIDAKEAYRVAHATAYVASTEKTDSARKASADTATSDLRVMRDRAEVEERATYHAMIFARGSAGESEVSL